MMINGTKVQVDSVLGLIKVIQSNSNSNILATPQIIALDNSEANFESAEKIPLLSTTAVQATVTQSVTYQSVALSINIKPQISKITNFVKLDVTAKLGNISPRVPPKALQDQAVSTIDRTAKTTVVAGDSDTIVLGGLIRDNVSDTVRKVPLLGDIPILGWLFKSKSSAIQKTNLVIFMTPHIVRQYEKVRAILDKKLKERDEFIETSAGGEDPSRYKRDDIIRSLPDLKDITEKKAKTTFVIDDEEPRKDAEKPAAVQKPADQSWFNPEGRIPGGSSGPSSPASPPGSFSSSSTPTGVQPQSVENILVPTAPLEGNPGTNPAEPSGTPGQ